MKNLKILIFSSLCLFVASALHGQTMRPPNPGFKNTIGTALSTGVFFDKPAYFFGWSVDYAHVVGEKWILLGGLAYDQEHKTEVKAGEMKVIHTLTPNVAVGYAVSRNLAFGFGIGKGMWDTDNSEKKMKFTTSGNLTIGILASYVILFQGPHGIDVTAGLERGLITPETNVTFELGYGYSF